MEHLCAHACFPGGSPNRVMACIKDEDCNREQQKIYLSVWISWYCVVVLAWLWFQSWLDLHLSPVEVS